MSGGRGRPALSHSHSMVPGGLLVTDRPPVNDTLSTTSGYRVPSARGSCAAKAPASVGFDAFQPGCSPGASCPVRAT